MKKLLALLLALSLLALLCACGTAREPLSGSGTQADPYQIGTPGQLLTFAEMAGQQEHSAAFYILTADIDLGGRRWTPVGTEALPFSGTLDGRGHTLSGLKISGDGMDIGFFGKLRGRVTDLVLEQVQVEATHDSARAGAFAGDLGGGVLEGCRTGSSVSVTGSYHVGGLVGRGNDGAQLLDCVNGATVNGTGIICCAGGIAGYLRCPAVRCVNEGQILSEADGAGIAPSAIATLEDCANEGTVTATKYAGGIVCSFSDGALNHSQNDSSVSLIRCVNSGSVTSAEDCAAGIAVSCRTGSLVDCRNSGDIRAAQHAGGIFAYFQISSFGGGAEVFTLTGCLNSGSVLSRTDGFTYSAGGIGGQVWGEKTQIRLERCVNSGSVETAAACGGILGDGTFRDLQAIGCINSGAVTGARFAGGILGRATPAEEGESSLLFENCANSGQIYAAAPSGLYDSYYCGGILGHSDKVSLSEVTFREVSFPGCLNMGGLSGAVDGTTLCLHDLCGTYAQ